MDMIKTRIVLEKRKYNNHKNTIIMRKLLSASAIIVALVMTSCSPFQVRSDYSAVADFTQYKTYKLRIDDLKLNDLDKDRVLNEISRQLKAKGLNPGENPDIIVNLKANHKKKTDIQYGGGFGWGGPFGWGMGMNRTWTSHYNEGALIFDFIDNKTQKLVWQGIGSGISVDSPNAKRKQIPAIVEEIMANYPPQKAK